MKLTGLKLGALLCIVTFSASAAGYISGVNASKENTRQEKPGGEVSERTSLSSEKGHEEKIFSAVSVENEFFQAYVVKEHEGKLALFMRYASGEEAIHDVYDISVSHLPSRDREELKKGIICNSLSDALQLVEDYSS